MISLRDTFLNKTLFFLIWICFSSVGYSQNESTPPTDSVKMIVSSPAATQVIDQDTSSHKLENSPLDISQNRGLYIMADEGKLQSVFWVQYGFQLFMITGI